MEFDFRLISQITGFHQHSKRNFKKILKSLIFLTIFAINLKKSCYEWLLIFLCVFASKAAIITLYKEMQRAFLKHRKSRKLSVELSIILRLGVQRVFIAFTSKGNKKYEN